MATVSKKDCEYIRSQAKQRFDKVRTTWVDAGRWALPHRNRWLLAHTEGERNNQHIVDITHVLALRSSVAGFLEGNTSATRKWVMHGVGDMEKNLKPENHAWLDLLNRRVLEHLALSNYYHEAGMFYYDYNTYNTGSHYIDELPDGRLFFHTLIPGSYYVLNNGLGEATILVREFAMTVKALVDTYGRTIDGTFDWSNISSRVKKMYDDGNYGEIVDVVIVVKPNDDYDANEPTSGMNRPWLDIHYEAAAGSGQTYLTHQVGQGGVTSEADDRKYLRIEARTRKPFIVGKSHASNNFEYGEKGPTTDCLGLIKSLNKKAIGKDIALDKMIKPAVQGPAHLKKSYVTTQANAFVPLDPKAMSQNGLRTIHEINPAVAALMQDQNELKKEVRQAYYADFLLFLTSNPKTRTAAEINAVLGEQQLVIGPILQSLNWTYNVPLIDYVTDYVMENDPFLPPPPADLAGEFIRPEFISIFAQAQRAADLPAIDRYLSMVQGAAQINPSILDKVNLDKLADLYEDRLYLPAGLNRPQEEVEARREQMQAQAQKQQQIEQLQQMASAAKDAGIQAQQGVEA